MHHKWEEIIACFMQQNNHYKNHKGPTHDEKSPRVIEG